MGIATAESDSSPEGLPHLNNSSDTTDYGTDDPVNGIMVGIQVLMVILMKL